MSSRALTWMGGEVGVAREPESLADRALASLVSTVPAWERCSGSYSRALRQIARYLPYDRIVILLEGESGAGKTIMARRIHEASNRRLGPFVEVNVAAMDPTLVGSELFGHVRGAYTDAREQRMGLVRSADKGTLFLDEIGKAGREAQHRLLSLLERPMVRPIGSDRELPVDVRLVAASNVPVERLAAEGNLLPDLVPRLRHFRVVLPSLCERRADIPGLVQGMVERHARTYGYCESPPQVEPPLLEALKGANWPDNLRELDATVQKLLVEASHSNSLSLIHCRGDLSYLRRPPQIEATLRRKLTPEVVNEAMLQSGGNQSEAARLLDVARTTLIRNLGRAGERQESCSTDEL